MLAEHRGALPQDQHQPAQSGAPDLSLPPARLGHRPAEPGLGDGHDLHPDAAKVRLSLRRARLGHTAQDINHWHLRLILSENLFEPSQRAFMLFKTWQHAKRASVEHFIPRFLPPDGISEAEAEVLIGKGLGHTRRVVDVNLFDCLQIFWYAVFAASFGVSVWFFI